jgi:hypothetical protein
MILFSLSDLALAAEPALFQVGRARVCVTPALGAKLAGYFHDREATYVRDDIFVRAVVIDNGETQLALVSCDLISMTAEVADPAKAIIEEKTGIPAGNILICATHTHTGPELRPRGSVARDEEWTKDLVHRIAEAVINAHEGKVAARLCAGEADASGYSFNRIFRRKDGSEVFGRSASDKTIIGSAGPVDPALQTLSAVDESGKLIAVLINFAMHPDVIGGGSADFISGDWPGLMSNTLTDVYGEEMVTLLLQGTCGDINHNPYGKTFLPTSGPAKAEQLGRALAGAAMVALERAEPMTDSSLAVAHKVLELPFYTRDEAIFKEMDALEKKEKLSIMEEANIRRVREWANDGKTTSVPIQTMRIGEVGLAAFPAEIFVRIGLEVKYWSQAPRTFVVELANDRVSTYVPDTDHADRGAYGQRPILSRWLQSDAGRHMADAAIDMLYGLFPKE